jgi:hypothetical protein
MEKIESARAMISNAYFTKEMVVVWLSREDTAPELVPDLIHKLEALSSSELSSVLPQLMSVLFSRKVAPLERFLVHSCREGMAKYLTVRWHFDSFVEVFTSRDQAATIQRISSNIEKSWVNQNENFEGLSDEAIRVRL